MRVPSRRAVVSSCLEVAEAVDLAALFEPHLNVCVWMRPVDAGLTPWLDSLLAAEPFLRVKEVTVGAPALDGFLALLPDSPGRERFQRELEGVVELFGAERVGLRLGTWGAPMCPRFHVDRIGVRLLCTYAGAGTEYLDNADVRREALGVPTVGEAEAVARPGARVGRAPPFAVVLLKGEAWPDNEGGGAVHRSPPGTDRRLLLSVDLL